MFYKIFFVCQISFITKEIVFKSENPDDNAEFYLLSYPAHSVCGGTGIYHNGKLYKSNVYRYGHPILAPFGQGKVGLVYYYDIDGRKITEIKILSITAKDCFTTSHSYFLEGHRRFHDWCYEFDIVLRSAEKLSAKNIVVATGLYTQSKDAKIKTSKQGEIVIDDIQEGKIPIKMFVKVSPEMKVEDLKTIEHKQGRKKSWCL